MKDTVIKHSLAALAVLLVTTSLANAQQINGTSGSPSATVTIDGKQLPPPPMPFGGVIKETAPESKPYWPPRVVPPKGAPNVLLIMTDDQGYGVSGTKNFGADWQLRFQFQFLLPKKILSKL